MRHPLPTRALCFSCFLVLVGLFFSPIGSARADARPGASCLTTGWPQDNSDLSPDPELVFGQLPNGLRYVLRANANPRQRVAMYLNVQSGSLHETEAERGVAHFLEHMLFNGTTHYPPGTLVQYFQSLGMGFGGDTNAHTSFDETVYNLLLPSNETAVLAEGFKVLADYARGALLLEEEVNRERGVILAEKRSRDSAATQVSKKQMQFDFAGTLVAERDPIGIESVLKAADSRLLRRYYDRWYRPENMIVVVVGDVRPEVVEPLLSQAFAPLRGVGEIGQCPDYGRVRDRGVETLVLDEQELGYTGLAVTTVFNSPPVPDTLAWETAQLQGYVAMTLLNNRLKQVEQRPSSPLAQPMAHAGVFLQHYGFATLSGRAVDGQWQQGLHLLQTTLGQALRDGFTENELERGKREARALLAKAAQTAATRDSRELGQSIIRTLNDGEVILSPAQEMALYGPVLEKLTLAEVNEALRRWWSRPSRLVEVVGMVPRELANAQGEAMVRQAYTVNEQQPVKPWVAAENRSFPYLSLPTGQGIIVEKTDHHAVGVTSCFLQGGVRINVKPTDFQANQVTLSVQFGQGMRSEPRRGMALLAQGVVADSGIGKLTGDQLQEALAGHPVELAFSVGPESFSFAGSALSQDFDLLLQLLYHRLHDPALRPDAYARSRDSLQRMYRQLASTVEGMAQIKGERFLAGNLPEYGMASWEEVESVTLEQIRSWLLPVFTQAPLEINVVGDIDSAAAIALVSRYFGQEQRQASSAAAIDAPLFPAGQQLELTVPSSIDKAHLTVAWQTDDFWEIERTRRLNLLAAVLDDRLRIKIREELGATYAPRVISRPSRGQEGFGLLQSALVVDPTQATKLAGIIRETAATLGNGGVSEDELRRALEPTLTAIKDIKRNNRYWLESVLNLSGRHPLQLQWPLTITESFAAIKAEELTALARRYLAAEQAATVIVRPAPELH
jgi:zinc protease